MNLGFRLYDPVIGRFLSVDPLFEMQIGINPYHYCGNDPVNASDPSGLCSDCGEDCVIGPFYGNVNGGDNKKQSSVPGSWVDSELSANDYAIYGIKNRIMTLTGSPRRDAPGKLTTENGQISTTITVDIAGFKIIGGENCVSQSPNNTTPINEDECLKAFQDQTFKLDRLKEFLRRLIPQRDAIETSILEGIIDAPFTIGKLIFKANSPTFEMYHEFGHRIQYELLSRSLSTFILFIGIPSALTYKNDEHMSYWYEMQATFLGYLFYGDYGAIYKDVWRPLIRNQQVFQNVFNFQGFGWLKLFSFTIGRAF